MLDSTLIFDCRFNDSLAHADAENGDLSGKMSNRISANSRICVRMTRARTNDELSRIQRNELFDGDLVVPVDSYGCPLQSEILVDIPGERVIIVDEDEVGSIRKRRSWRRLLRRMINKVESRHCSDNNVRFSLRVTERAIKLLDNYMRLLEQSSTKHPGYF